MRRSIILVITLFIIVANTVSYEKKNVNGEKQYIIHNREVSNEFIIDLTDQTNISVEFNDMKWKSDNSYALIVGDDGIILKFDGISFNNLSNPFEINYNFNALAWKPDDSYAIIVGTGGKILKFDGYKFTDLSNLTKEIRPANEVLEFTDIEWNENGSYAFLIGYKITFGTTTVLMKYDGEHLISVGTPDYSGDFWAPRDLALRPNSEYMLCSGNNEILRYDGNKFEYIFSNISEEINSAWTANIEWKPDASYAIITGGSSLLITEGNAIYPQYIFKYDGGNFINISNENLKFYLFRDIEWITGEYAIFTGNDIEDDSGLFVGFDGKNFVDLSSEINTTRMLKKICYNSKENYAIMIGERVILKFQFMEDSDNDDIPDQLDTDDDNDSYLDIWEEFLGTNPKNNLDKPIDFDNDGLPNGDFNNSQPWMDRDDDNDEHPDAEDASPNDPNRWKPENDNNNYWLIIVLIIVVILFIIGIGLVLYLKYHSNEPVEKYGVNTNRNPHNNKHKNENRASSRLKNNRNRTVYETRSRR